MQFLQDLQILKEKDDLSKLPEDIIKDLKKLIRDGAADLDLEWPNSLELVKRAYTVQGIERPTPAERTAYTQFEELLKYAVEQLADARKDTGNSWRMSSTVFREFKESMEKVCRFRVYEVSDKAGKGWTVEAKNMETIVDMVRNQASGAGFDMDVKEHDPSSCTCNFSYQGIQRPYKVSIQRL